MTISIDAQAPAGPLDGVCLPEPMERELLELWRRVDEVRELPDAADATGADALAAATVIARVRTAADALLAPFAARLDELSGPTLASRFARGQGFASAAALLSAKTGLSMSEAGKVIGVGHTLAQADRVEAFEAGTDSGPPEWAAEPGVPDVESPAVLQEEPVPAIVRPPRRVSPLAAAIRAGVLGTEKVSIIRRTLADMTINTAETEAFLVEQAHRLGITALRRLCLETLAERDGKGLALREARQRKARYVKFTEEPDGMLSFYGALDAASAAPIKAWMEAELQAEAFGERELPEERQRTIGQMMADVFVATCRHAAGCTKATTRPKTTVVIHASRESLRTGQGCATVDGIETPVTIATALAMAVDAEFIALLEGEHGVPLNEGRAKRSATTPQRHAVMRRDKGCAKCSRAISRCDSHHIINWAHGGKTDVKNLVMMCVSCHHIVHEEGWDIEVINNEVWFIPPAKLDPLRRRQPGSSVRLAP